MDNLKLIKDRINQDIDPAGAPGSILAVNHNEIDQAMLVNLGKYVGSSYVAVKTATVFNSGVFSWEGNAMNNVTDFTIKVAKKTSDLNDFGLLLDTLVETDIIQFKDFAGRSVYLVFKSFSSGTDGSGNPIYNIVVAGLAENPNYIYQTNESEICVLSLNKQIVPINGFVPDGGYTGTGQDLKDEIDLKLNIADYNQYFQGKYASLGALETAKPTGKDGDYAIVDPGTGVDAIEFLWDLEEGWVQGGSMGATTTDTLPEGSVNLYFTVARVLATLLTGLSVVTGGAILPTDSILIAFGKIQKNITDILASIALKQDIITDVNLGSFINSLTSKTTPVDADFSVFMDSADSNKTKKVSWANIKATLKAYFDPFYDYPQITITTAVSITTATTDGTGRGQKGKNVIIANSTNAINITVDGGTDFAASYLKHGSATITFVQGSGRTLISVDGTSVLNGAVGSVACISSVGTSDYLQIFNA